MRLIDADYLLKELEEWQEDLDDAISGRQLGVTDAIVIACQMPTIDAMPVRHGKWMLYYDIEQGRALRCSECKMVFWVGDGREGNYCPNCGAKMDGEANETV